MCLSSAGRFSFLTGTLLSSPQPPEQVGTPSGQPSESSESELAGERKEAPLVFSRKHTGGAHSRAASESAASESAAPPSAHGAHAPLRQDEGQEVPSAINPNSVSSVLLFWDEWMLALVRQLWRRQASHTPCHWECALAPPPCH